MTKKCLEDGLTYIFSSLNILTDILTEIYGDCDVVDINCRHVKRVKYLRKIQTFQKHKQHL